MQEIPVTAIRSIAIGQAEDAVGATGCTVFISEEGMPAGLDVRGGGPASRDSQLLDPVATAQTVHGILLAGGSAFGLDAAGGVMECLEEKGIGYPVGPTRVPLVCQSNLFDLAVGDPKVRPGKALGRQAALAALQGGNYRDGNFGAGCGATVGKLYGVSRAMKSGIGSYALRLGELELGAVVAVNSLGDIFDCESGRQLAGLLNEARDGLASSEEELYRLVKPVNNKFTGNTTLGVVMTNAKFDKTRLCKIAAMAHDGFARAICPVHSTADGDSIYALSLGELETDLDLVGTLAAKAVSRAIVRAVLAAESAYGFPAAREFIK